MPQQSSPALPDLGCVFRFRASKQGSHRSQPALQAHAAARRREPVQLEWLSSSSYVPGFLDVSFPWNASNRKPNSYVLNQPAKFLMIASATFRTVLKISLLPGFGFRQRRFNSPRAFSSALICSGSSPSRPCMDLSSSMQNCKFLSFIPFSFSGSLLPVPQRQLPRRNGPNRKTHPTCAAQTLATYTPNPAHMYLGTSYLEYK